MKTIGCILLCGCMAAIAADTDANSPTNNKWTQPSAQGHWAYQPVHRPSTPSVQNQSWVRSPIDALVLARMEA